MSLTNFINTNKQQQTTPDIKVEKITPDVAAAFLKVNKINRAPSQAHIGALAKRMIAGEWELNGDSIRFDCDGCLIDGQHRLHAVIKSGVSIDTLVVRNMNREVFKTIDEGRPRGGADIISIEHKQHSREIAAALRLVDASDLKSEWNGWMKQSASKISNKKMISLFYQHPGIVESTERMMQSDRKMCRKLLTASVCIFSHYWMSIIEPEDAEQFFEWLEYGEQITREHPVGALRNRLMSMLGASRGSAVKREQLAITFKAWNAARNGEDIKLLRYSQTQKFPTPA